MAVFINTERLSLRPLVADDCESLYLLDQNPKVRAFFPEGTLEKEQIQKDLQRHLLSWEAKGFGIFGVIHRESQRFIGRCGFAQLSNGIIELGYLFLPDYWGQGYATEAAGASLKWGFEHMPTDRIVGWAPENHLASRRVLEKCGMQFEKMGFYKEVPCAFYQILRSGL